MAIERGPNHYQALKDTSANVQEQVQAQPQPQPQPQPQAPQQQKQPFDWQAVSELQQADINKRLEAARTDGIKPVEVRHLAGRLENQAVVEQNLIAERLNRDPAKIERADEKHADPRLKRALELMEAVQAQKTEKQREAERSHEI